MKKILILFSAISLIGCASYFKKKDCEAINWFEHGKKVALSGKWLNSDSVVSECRKVEAEMSESALDQGFKNGMQQYCSSENSYLVGKSGDTFSRDLCEGPQINVLLNQHKKGLADYCAKSNGYNAGISGKKYSGLCPKDLEPAFLPEYRKGRKKFVETLIANKKAEISEIERKISSKQADLWSEESRLRHLEMDKNSLESQKSSLDPSNFSENSVLDSQINGVSNEIWNVKSGISSTQSSISSLNQNKEALQKEIGELNLEKASLD